MKHGSTISKCQLSGSDRRDTRLGFRGAACWCGGPRGGARRRTLILYFLLSCGRYPRRDRQPLLELAPSPVPCSQWPSFSPGGHHSSARVTKLGSKSEPTYPGCRAISPGDKVDRTPTGWGVLVQAGLSLLPFLSDHGSSQ